MAERICDACGKKKKLEGGKTCEKGHLELHVQFAKLN